MLNRLKIVIKKIKYFDESGLLTKCVTKTIKNETKEQSCGFLGMLLGTLDASLLGNMLADKVQGEIRAGKIFKAASSFN